MTRKGLEPPLPSRPLARPLSLLGLLALLLLAGRALAADYNFAGSVSLNYKTLVNRLEEPRQQRQLLMGGFNVNASVKAVVDVNSKLSATVKLCYGCHGLEAINTFAEFTPHPLFNIRAGRFQPAFGDFYLRHDPTVHKTPDNPLPYDMGHMIRIREWGNSVVPMPYSDNGAEVFGTGRPTDFLTLAYAVHVVSGWKGPEGTAPVQDFALRRMRFVTATDYLVDNNRYPSFGGRLAMSFSRRRGWSAAVPEFTLGGSVLSGTYDDDDRLRYLIWAVDAWLRIWRLNLRGEFVRRQQDIDPRQSELADGTVVGSLNKMNVAPPVSYKDGFYVEADFPVGRHLEVVLRWDGMLRSGARPARTDPDRTPATPYTPPATAALAPEDWLFRYTGGINIIPITGAKLKLAYEFWQVKDTPDRGTVTLAFQNEHMVHLALVSSF